MIEHTFGGRSSAEAGVNPFRFPIQTVDKAADPEGDFERHYHRGRT